MRPIAPADLDHLVLRCWPQEEAVIRELFELQGTIGMAAWEGERCVGVLHGYRIELPDGTNPHWPSWNDWWTKGWRPRLAGMGEPRLRGPAWCHACCHVGRTLDAARTSDNPDPRYFGRGIGGALCRASVEWARSQGCAAVLAPGAPEGLFAFATWAGALPWTTYRRLGFEAIPVSPEEAARLPAWAQGDSPPEVMAQVRRALADGRPAHEFHQPLMVLALGR